MAYVILTIAQYLFEAYLFAIIFWVLSSWIPPLRDSAIGQWIGNLVEPYLSLFRFIPPIGMIDISPVLAIILYQYVIYPFAYRGLATILSWIIP